MSAGQLSSSESTQHTAPLGQLPHPSSHLEDTNHLPVARPRGLRPEWEWAPGSGCWASKASLEMCILKDLPLPTAWPSASQEILENPADAVKHQRAGLRGLGQKDERRERRSSLWGGQSLDAQDLQNVDPFRAGPIPVRCPHSTSRALPGTCWFTDGLAAHGCCLLRCPYPGAVSFTVRRWTTASVAISLFPRNAE